MTWHVWCDGSCHHGQPQVPKGTLGWGGWAAIVEHGSEGLVLRGRVPDTTNVRMELHAAAQGLSAVAGVGQPVVLHTDCTTILVVQDWWAGGRVDSYTGRDSRQWRELAAEFARNDVRIDLLTRGGYGPIHRRAHTMAGAEARGGLRNLPINATPLEAEHHRIRKGMRRVTHAAGCKPSLCVATCPIRRRHEQTASLVRDFPSGGERALNDRARRDRPVDLPGVAEA